MHCTLHSASLNTLLTPHVRNFSWHMDEWSSDQETERFIASACADIREI